jgi:uncharacterized protein (TIGR00661 family)
MAKILYSMSGEGRGHATRVRAVVEMLRDRHEVVLYAPGDAYDLLAPAYAGSEVRVNRIPCLRFHYTSKRLNPVATVQAGVGYLTKLPRLVRQLRKEIDDECPDLVVTDFEPALPRAAKVAGVPFLSLDHQHFLTYSDLAELSAGQRWRAWMWGQVVARYYSGQVESVVSSFFCAPLKKNLRDKVTRIGVLLQPEILAADRRSQGWLLVYQRKFSSPALLGALKKLGVPVRVYGLGERSAEGNLQFFPVDQQRFLEDLAGCEALVTTAGNQVVGEALYLGKPVLALPESNNHEQEINAHFLKASGAGDWADWERVTTDDLRRFLSRLDEFRSHIDVDWLNGNPAALAAIERHLPSSDAAPKRGAELVGAR